MGVSHMVKHRRFLLLLLLCKGLNMFSYYKPNLLGPDFGFGIDVVRLMQVYIIESSCIGTCKVRFIQDSV